MEVDQAQWPLLSRLLDEALDLPSNQRDTWLESLPQAHVALRDTLRALLRSHAEAESYEFLGTVPKLDAANDAPEVERAPSLVAGTAIGPYIIEEELGRGGMGAVWRARRADGVLKRPVALKLPHPGPYGAELIDRFARERDILAALAHPHIARLYDAGVDAGGQPFLALEYVSGHALTRYCDDRRLDVRSRLRLFQQVLSAVQYAHARLVVHRDIKPSNVMVGEDGQSMLLDFGIAKLLAADAAEEAQRTQFQPALTPDYASPEQVRGEQVTTASDIYSLGVLLFELLTGQLPYRLKRGSRAELEEAVLNADVPRPSQSIRAQTAGARATTVKGLARTLRGDLDTIILKALRKEPTQRYATADAFLQDIERYLRGLAVLARPDSSWYRLRKFVTRHQLPVSAAALGLVAITATAAIALYEARAAAVERDRALALSSRNEAVSDFLSTVITEAGSAGHPVSVSDMVERSRALVSSRYRNEPEHRAAVLSMLGIYYHTVGDDAHAEPILREALDALHTSPDGDLRRSVTCDHAMSASALGRIEESTKALKAVIADPGSSAARSAQCLEYLAFMAQDAGDASDALKYGNLALQRLQDVKNHSLEQEAMFIASVGYGEHLNGRNDIADRLYQQSLAEFGRAGRDRNADAVSVRNNWAIVSDGAGVPRRSLALYDETLAIFAHNDPNASPPPYLLGNRAKALSSLGRFAEATPVFQQCVQRGIEAQEVNSQAFCLLGLESVAEDVGDLPAAQMYLSRVNALIGSGLPEGHPGAVGARIARARIDTARRDFANAHSVIDPVLSSAKSDAARTAALLARSELNLQSESLGTAESDAREALSLVQRAQGGVPYSNRTGLALLLLGRVLAREGRAADAHEVFGKAVLNLENTVDDGHPSLKQARELLRHEL